MDEGEVKFASQEELIRPCIWTEQKPALCSLAANLVDFDRRRFVFAL